MEIPILKEVVVMLGLSMVVILVFQRLKLPSILGFLITGIIAGPHGLELVKASHEVEILAEIGVILLLFIIGLEFSLKSLAAIKFAVFIGGAVQVLGTIATAALIVSLFDFDWPTAIFTGFLFSLSSTAIVLKLLQQKGAISSPQGKVSLAILIFQDIIVVPMMLFTPLLAGKADNVAMTLLILLVKVVLIIIMVLISARYLAPRLLYAAAKTKSKEVFILTVVVICFSVAWLTSEVGLSLALGAFLAGLIISESEYNHQATSNILPFREIFTSFFFVSIGMLLETRFLVEHLLVIVGFTLVTILGKAAIAGLATWILRYPRRTVLLVSLSLFQVGEFAFILSKTGIENGLLPDELYQYFLSVSILSMAITPFVIEYCDVIANKLLSPHKSVIQNQNGQANTQEVSDHHDYHDHLIIIGYGLNGKNVALAAKNAKIPYVILELNPYTVKKEKANGEPIIYGDAVDDTILYHVNAHKARVIVVAISDPNATKKIIANIRSISQTVYVIIRTRFIQEVEENLRLGADEVIPEEFETSIEIFTRVLYKYLVPEDDIEEFVQQIRSDNYEMLRPLPKVSKELKKPKIELPNIDIICYKVDQGNNQVIGHTIGESEIRKLFGVTIVAIKRDDEFIYNIEPQTKILQGDQLYIFGEHDKLVTFSKKVVI
jgi:CPA2 family monovalent cation:H+ antiporter-2